MDGTASLAPHYQGYVDERSICHVKGWLRDVNDTARRLEYELVLPVPGGERVLARGVADRFSDVLRQVGVGDGTYAFQAEFAPLHPAERDSLFVRPTGAAHRLELAPGLRTDPPGFGPYQGYVDERSIAHAAGWVWDLADAARHVAVEIVLPGPDGEEILASGSASQHSAALRQVGIGDGSYSFFLLYARPLTEAERDAVQVRVAGSAHVLELSPRLNARFEPVHHVAMDIVNNCNLRCPFCVYDYKDTKKTYVMSDETFQAALRLIPYVTDGNFWLSCLHEATLHPRLMDFIEMVPRAYRHKLFFTTNLAKRMKRDYFEGLARSGMSHINISLESLDEPVYEKMRKGARFGIFMDNWAQLLEVFAATPGAPRIRYNMMAYRSNLREIPGLLRVLLDEKQGWQVEIRHTFDGPQIPAAFRAEEFLSSTEWAWLADALQGHDPEKVILLLPPGGKGHDHEADAAALRESVAAPGEDDLAPALAAPEAGPKYQEWEITHGKVPRPFNLRIAWDGTLNVYAEQPRAPGEPPTHANYMITNINDLADPLAALFALA